METRLDERFSDPGSAATGWAETTRALEEAQISWLTTVRADGRPHVTPLVAVWLDGAVHFGTGTTEQKYLNLTANPNVVLTTGRNAWDDSLDVMVEGAVRRVTGRSKLEQLAAAWRQKWDGSWAYEPTDNGFRLGDHDVAVFAVEPAKVLVFGRQRKEPSEPPTHSTVEFTHTSHRP
ncbi:pyridoxamine 5'-phosphate oxidase family protein [Amycolatopsis sp. NPDC051716]|jgi:general stress protein 26|uniref:pyridoxamine 5'-phosphate oxidase family protein n=1 Tax=Amycolatopsis sp. NPDC051716 TaxID=3155804 RepID=UPI00344466DF